MQSVGREDWHWTHLAQYRLQGLAIAKKVMRKRNSRKVRHQMSYHQFLLCFHCGHKNADTNLYEP
jgi:hypothetical protein